MRSMGRGRARAVCIHAFPKGSCTWVPANMATATATAPALGPHPYPRRTRRPQLPLLLHSTAFKALSSMLAGLGRGWACPSPETQFNRREGATNPWCRNHTCHSNNSPRYYNSCFSLMRNVASRASWGKGRDLVPASHPVHPHPSLPLPSSHPLASSPVVRRRPPAFRGLKEPTSATFSIPAQSCLCSALPCRACPDAVWRRRLRASGMCLTFDSRLTASPVFLDACNILCLIFPKNASSPRSRPLRSAYMMWTAIHAALHTSTTPTNGTTTSSSWPFPWLRPNSLWTPFSV